MARIRSPKKYLTCDPPVKSIADEIAYAPPDAIYEAIARVIEWTGHPDNDPDLTPAEFLLRKLVEDADIILTEENHPTELSDVEWMGREQIGQDGSPLSVRVSSAVDVLLAADIVRKRHPDKPGGTLSTDRIRKIIKPA